jgi:hypothetical protein
MSVLPTFQPSNAGAQLHAQVFGAAEGFQNLFARAEAMKQSRERLEMEKARFAREAGMAVLDTKERELRLKQAANQLDIADKTKASQLAIADAQKVQAEQEIATAKAEEDLFAALPSALRGVSNIAEDDYDGLLNAFTSFQRVYGHLGSGKHAARFAAVAGPQLETLTGRLASSQMLLDRYAQKVLPQLQLALLAEDGGASLMKILNDPMVQRAAFSNGEAGKALQAAWTEGMKELQARKTKVEEKKAAEQVATNKEQRKLDRELSVEGWEGQAPTKEEAVTFRTEVINTEQITASIDDLIGLAKQYQATNDPAEKAKLYALADQKAGMMVGKLRLPLTGPGAFTDSERAFVADTIGNPTKIFSLSSIEFAKLNAMKSKLEQGVEIMGKGLGYSRSKKQADGGFAEGQEITVDNNGTPVTGKAIVRNGRKAILSGTQIFYLE